MKTRTTVSGLVIACIVLVGACKTQEGAQSDAMPDTMEGQLVEQHIAALGGMDNLEDIQSLKWTGAADMMGNSMAYTLYQERPGKMRTEFDMSNMGGTMTSAYDGTVAWSDNPMQGGGPQPVDDNRAQSMMEQAAIGSFLVDYRDMGYELMYDGEATVQGTPALKLNVMRPDSSVITTYLDAETYLIVKTETEGSNPQFGSFTVQTLYSDYRDVDGVQLPFTVESIIGSSNGEFSWEVTFDEVEVNPDIDDALFTMPQ